MEKVRIVLNWNCILGMLAEKLMKSFWNHIMHAYFINKIAFNLEGNKGAELNKDVGCEKWEMRMKSEKINPGSFHKKWFPFLYG